MKCFYCLPVVLIGILLSNCGGRQEWYPAGSVEIVTFYEQKDDFGAVCIVTYRIKNTGAVEIKQTTIAIVLETDSATYYDTLIDQTPVPPAKSILGNAEIPYYSSEESMSENGISIEDFFFK